MDLMKATPPNLYNALKAEGFQLPDECGDVKLVMPVDGVYQLHYVVNLTPRDLLRIGRALASVADAAETSRLVHGEGWQGRSTVPRDKDLTPKL